MATNSFSCPHCGYEAPLAWFENVGEGDLKCRRCRSRFPDPNAYLPGMAYADCDFLRPATRFPFSLDGASAMIHVREGYMALLSGGGGVRVWIEGPDCPVKDLPGDSHIYYVCLTPTVPWGTSGVEEFGVYGTAQLSLSRDYVKSFFGIDGSVSELEEHLRKLVNERVTEYVRSEIERNNINSLEHRDDYQRTLGTLEEGVSLTRIRPLGFRNAKGKTGSFSSVVSRDTQTGRSEPTVLLPTPPPPAEILKPPKKSYEIGSGVEELLLRGNSRPERHKAGERMDAERLRDVQKLIRYRSKEFELPFGWGVYNQTRPVSGYYSAQGTVSFYIDSTERLGLALDKTKSWKDFEDQFFTNVFKSEVSFWLRELLNSRFGRKDFDPNRIEDYLSAMSVELTDVLNGEGRAAGKEPAFRRFGLRVKQTDILGIDFYSVRR